jgi:Transposase DDE domain
MRYVPRDLHEDARDVARRLAKTEAFEQSRRNRKRVEMLFAHLKRILRLGRLRLRGPRGAQFTLAAIAQSLRRLAKLIARPPPKVAQCPFRDLAFRRSIKLLKEPMVRAHRKSKHHEPHN